MGFDAKTTYERSKQPIHKTDVKVGDRIVIHAVEVNETLVAHTVEIGGTAAPKQAAKPMKKAAPPVNAYSADRDR